MGWAHKKQQKSRKNAGIDPADLTFDAAPPELVRRRQNRQSTIKSGRTIGEKREKLETKSERQAAHRKSRRRRRTRIFFVSLAFALAAVLIVALYFFFFRRGDAPLVPEPVAKTYEPSIEIVDEAAATSGSALTDRMKNYIGQAEADFRDLGYTPVKAVIPTGAIREVDFYLKDQPGFVKLILDRDTAPSVEDADRLIRYLKSQNISTYEYLDVRLPQKAYWK